jgi:NAD(P)H dehydrogenase (quinone)
MPKLLVLYDASEPALARLAEAIAAGARAVRFAEVDLRRAGDADAAVEASRPPTLAQAEELDRYDGIAVGIPARDGDRPSAAESMLARFDGSLVNKVGSAFTATEGGARRETLWRALTPMAERGMILVAASFAEGDADEAALGRRLAEVIGWVTHARSHHHHH